MFLSREQVRALDRKAMAEFGMPGVVLMENAGRGTAELLLALGVAGRVALCCGKGNNGGDGFVIARHLANCGVEVRILLFARPEELHGDAEVNYRIIARSGLPVVALTAEPLDLAALQHELSVSEWVVDALFGTGLTGPLRSPFDQVVEAINTAAARVLAVDIPSGLDCDTGQPLGPTVRAHHTATMAALKQGFAEPSARTWLGAVHLVDLGVPAALLSQVRKEGN
jgi:NAD(P)H-hydrate epimerase